MMHCVKRMLLRVELFLWFAHGWTNWRGTLFRRGRKAGTRIRWDGQIVSFHVLSRYWTISGRGIKVSPALGVTSTYDRQGQRPNRNESGLRHA
jgi:hypothetical protein